MGTIERMKKAPLLAGPESDGPQRLLKSVMLSGSAQK
jgi:hypothetical protein